MQKYIYTSFSKRIDNGLSKVKNFFQKEVQSDFIHLVDSKKNNKQFKVQLNNATKKITETLILNEDINFDNYIISASDDSLSEAIKAFFQSGETIYIISDKTAFSYDEYYKSVKKLINKLINRCSNIQRIAINYMDLILSFILIQIFSSFSIEEDKNVRSVIRHEYLLH